MNREDLEFTSAGVTCAAWLYRPEGDGPHPMVVMAHGLGGTRDARLPAYAERFVAAGLGALVFDYRHFGASDGEPRQLVDIEGQLIDWTSAIAAARRVDWVNHRRVALWGTSFSGGHVLVAGARDGEVAAVVSQCPFIDGPAVLRLGGPGQALRLTAAGVRDQARALRNRDPYLIPLVGPPGSDAAMQTPDSEPGYLALIPPGSTWRNEMCARVALRLGTYRPGREAARLRCPLLMCPCDDDALTPADSAVWAAAQAPQGELRRYRCGHFDIYVGDWFEKAVAHQTEFLVRHLLEDPPDP